MKTLCIVDTCSLIYMSDVKLANKLLHKWLWDEFEVGYSQVVFDEINRHKMTMIGNERRRNWSNYVFSHPTIATSERTLFGSVLTRNIEAGTCKLCRQPIVGEQNFTPDLTQPEDKGERHNCCVALEAVVSRKYLRVIFITDDFRAQRDYIIPIFEKFPLGEIWSSLDFVTYLFLRYRNRIPLDEALSVLRDVNAKNPIGDNASKSARRLTSYQNKVTEIDRVLIQTRGG